LNKNHRKYNKVKEKVLDTKKKTKKSFPIFFQVGSDFLAFTLSFLLQYYFVFYSSFIGSESVPRLDVLFMGILLVNSYWFILNYFSGLYKNWYERSPFEEFFTIIRITFIGCAIAYFFVLNDTSHRPRMMIFIYFISILGFQSIFRLVIRRVQKMLRRKGIIKYKSIIIGSGDKINEIYNAMKGSPSWGLVPIGGILTSESHESQNNLNSKIIGEINNLDEIISSKHPEIIILASGDLSHDELLRVINICSLQKVRVKIEPDLYSIFTGQTKTHNIYGIPYMEVSPQLMKTWEELAKRIFDIIFSFFVIVIGAPFWILTGIIIKLESKGNVFYTQPRVGKDGKVFQIFKYRSMVSGADAGGQNWTKVGDSRVTRFGKFIRKSHLDEVPQFLNVFLGTMSVVGPRPEQPKFVEQFSKELPYYNRRLKVRPGITGWWQIKYTAHELNTDEIKSRLKDDFYYIENMSIKFDVEIIVRTIWSVLTGHGQT
jgi:exopolysaccharide biosynthesis polyprenyl glycosylphosphotransferase